MHLSDIPRIPTRRSWYLCPVCGQKLLIYDDTAKCTHVYLRCKKCGKEVEIKI